MIGDKGGTWFLPERRKQYMREYGRRRKAAFKEKGICPSCEKEPAAPNRTCCTKCLEDKKLSAKFGSAGPYRQLYADMFERQQGLCGICRMPMSRPMLDHCHKTMIVRGLLCSNCNVALGKFKDDPKLLTRAIQYITENEGVGISLKKRDPEM
jgi:hypothetical protein